MTAQKRKKKEMSDKILVFLNVYYPKTHLIKALYSLDSSRSYGGKSKNPKAGASTMLVIIFWNFTIFQQRSDSPQVKGNLISSIANSVYKLPHELPNDLKVVYSFISIYFRILILKLLGSSSFFAYSRFPLININYVNSALVYNFTDSFMLIGLNRLTNFVVYVFGKFDRMLNYGFF